jgi:diacylglycerol kinase family enzyme
MSHPEICVIYNPTAGRRRARARLDRARRALAGRAAFWPTTAAGHAEELATQAASAGFAIVAAAGGDGTVHEVVNGLLRAATPETALAILPVGSANDYAFSLGLNADSQFWCDPTIGPRLVDIGVVRSGARRRWFCNGLGLGFNGAVTLESRKIKWLQGLALYGLALLTALIRRYRFIHMTIGMDAEPERTTPTLALTLALGCREGNFVVAPDALLDDGLFNYIHVGQLSRWGFLCLAPGLFAGHLPKDHPLLRMGRCRSVRLHAQEPLLVHTDGEFFCRHEDGLRELEVEVLPGALRAYGRLPEP